jgi:hypothetical protein
MDGDGFDSPNVRRGRIALALARSSSSQGARDSIQSSEVEGDPDADPAPGFLPLIGTEKRAGRFSTSSVQSLMRLPRQVGYRECVYSLYINVISVPQAPFFIDLSMACLHFFAVSKYK